MNSGRRLSENDSSRRRGSEFDEDESLTWSILKAEDWNKEVCLGWRYSAAELKKLEPVSRKRKA